MVSKEEEERKKREQRERAMKEQRKGQIANEIDAWQQEIDNLFYSNLAYENMRTKINEALPKLTSARQNVKSSQVGLKGTYTSQEATKQEAKFQEIIQEISGVIENLNNPIMTEITRKINSNNQEIMARQSRIRQLQGELYSLG